MKNLLLSFLTIVSSGALSALPVGNPSEASLLTEGVVWERPRSGWCEAFSLRAGYYGDYVFNMHLEGHTDFENSEMYTNATYFALNFCNRVEAFSTLGVSRLFFETGLGDAMGGRLELETETNFSWSLGARATIWECGCTTFGAEAQYFYTNPHLTRVTVNGQSSAYLAPNFETRYREWQLGLGVSHRIYALVPYAALRWSRTKIDLNNTPFELTNGQTSQLDDLESKNTWGYAIGVTLVGCDRVCLTAEGRFASEKALYINGQIRL